MRERRRVAFGLYQGSDLPLREGVFRYAREHDWAVIVNPYQVRTSLKWIEHARGLDGVIGFVQYSELALVESLNLPVVSISRSGRLGLPTVVDDSERVGVEAAKHLLADCLLRRFGYLGRKEPPFSEYRMKGFVDTVEAAGFACSVWRTTGAIDAYHWQQEQEGLEGWLRSLRPPVGVMISDDPMVFPLLEAARRLGLRCPTDLAIVSANNESTCELTHPTLTSVDLSHARVGYEAASLLDRLMRGEPKPDCPILIPPAGVVRRESTEMLGIDDPAVIAAAKYAREHLARAFGVDDLVREAGTSRRRLETGFRNWLNQSPLQFITRLRVERAQLLLSGPTPMKLVAVAQACGFASLERFRVAFVTQTGVSPGAYRKQARQTPTGPTPGTIPPVSGPA